MDSTAFQGGRLPARCKRASRAIVLAGLVGLGDPRGPQAAAQCQGIKVTASDAQAQQCFGTAVGISGNVAVVGATGCSFLGGLGAAYVYHRDDTNWIEVQQLLPSEVGVGSAFALDVAVSGDTILVTAPGHSTVNPADGAAFLFRYNGVAWVETQKLYPLDGFSGWHFGWSAALDGNVAVVGQYGDSFAGAPESGALYVYRRTGTNWAFEQKLVPPDLGALDHFGTSVAVDGDVIVGGAPGNNNGRGAAYVFRWDGFTWIQQQKLTRSTGEQDGGFAFYVAISGNTAFVGSPFNRDQDYGPGTVSVYCYNGQSWLGTQTLTASDGGPGDFFGSVHVYGNRLLVQAVGIPSPEAPLGVVYFFQKAGERWIEKRKLAAQPELGQNSGFVGTALGDTYAVLGSPGDNDACPEDPYCNSGSAYIVDIPFCLTEIPAVSTWGLAGLAISVLFAGVLLLRRRGALAQVGPRAGEVVAEPVQRLAKRALAGTRRLAIMSIHAGSSL